MNRTAMLAVAAAGGLVSVLVLVAAVTWLSTGDSPPSSPEPQSRVPDQAPVAQPNPVDAPPAPTEPPLPKLEPIEQDPHNPVLPPTLRLADRVGLSQRGQRITGYQALDIKPQANFQMDVFQDEGQSTVNRLTIDMDRDGKLDESWVFDARGVVREVSAQDDGTWSGKERWDGGAWVAE